MPLFERLTSSTLRGRVAEKIRDAILQGTVKQGERIVERQLASQFATSLTVVREALIQLESEGFVTKKPNATTHVTELSREAAKKIFSVRRVLEGFAVEEAARVISAQQCEHLDELYSELLASARIKNTEMFVRKDMALHEAIWRISGNEYLESTLRRIALPIFAFTAIRLASRHPFDLMKDAASHFAFLEALKNGDPEGARHHFLSALDEWLAKIMRHVFTGEEAEATSAPVSEAKIKG